MFTRNILILLIYLLVECAKICDGKSPADSRPRITRGNQMTKKEREAFTQRALMVLTTAMADRNYKDAEIVAAALAQQYGVKISKAAA